MNTFFGTLKTKGIKLGALCALVFLVSIAGVSAADLSCNYVGQLVYNNAFYCNETLDASALKPLGTACSNGFECLDGSCLDGTCSVGYKREIKARESILQDIVNLLKGEVPAGYKTMNATAPAIFTASEMGLAANSMIDSIKITATKESGASITYDDLGSSKPVEAGVTSEPPGKIYHYISLATYKDISNDISSAEINFKIPKSWFELNNADKEKIKAYRWSSQWAELVTSKTGETADYVSYTATSPGFSIFAISADASQTAVTGQPTCSDGIQNQGETRVDCGGPCNACPAICGNEAIDSGENCESCSLDVSCPAPQICKYRQCINKPFPFWIIIVIAGAAVIIFFFSFKAVKNSGKAKKRDIERLSSAIEYAASSLKSGMPEKDVKDSLSKAGWNAKQISIAMKEAKKKLKK